MSELALAAAVLLASLTLTSFFCLRPMRRGNCAIARGRGRGQHPGQPPAQDAEITRLRQEVSALRAEHAAGPSSSSSSQ